MLTVSRVESRAHNVTHTHIVDLLIKFIQIRTNNTKPLYLNCYWISETEPSINKEHFCEVSNLGDTPLTPVQINSHKYMEQNYGKYDRTSLHFQCTINTKNAYPGKFSTRDSMTCHRDQSTSFFIVTTAIWYWPFSHVHLLLTTQFLQSMKHYFYTTKLLTSLFSRFWHFYVSLRKKH